MIHPTEEEMDEAFEDYIKMSSPLSRLSDEEESSDTASQPEEEAIVDSETEDSETEGAPSEIAIDEEEERHVDQTTSNADMEDVAIDVQEEEASPIAPLDYTNMPSRPTRKTLALMMSHPDFSWNDFFEAPSQQWRHVGAGTADGKKVPYRGDFFNDMFWNPHEE